MSCSRSVWKWPNQNAVSGQVWLNLWNEFGKNVAQSRKSIHLTSRKLENWTQKNAETKPPNHKVQNVAAWPLFWQLKIGSSLSFVTVLMPRRKGDEFLKVSWKWVFCLVNNKELSNKLSSIRSIGWADSNERDETKEVKGDKRQTRCEVKRLNRSKTFQKLGKKK